jgi:putative alpha-1,2-mannosidase
LSQDHPYVGEVTLDGKPLSRTYITHEEIMAGGTLHFTMQAEPNKLWGSEPGSRPYSMTEY